MSGAKFFQAMLNNCLESFRLSLVALSRDAEFLFIPGPQSSVQATLKKEQQVCDNAWSLRSSRGKPLNSCYYTFAELLPQDVLNLTNDILALQGRSRRHKEPIKICPQHAGGHRVSDCSALAWPNQSFRSGAGSKVRTDTKTAPAILGSYATKSHCHRERERERERERNKKNKTELHKSKSTIVTQCNLNPN